MSAEVPTISVTTARRYSPPESSSDDDSDSNDMNYNQNAGGVTDVEDLDSQCDLVHPRSRRSSQNALALPKTQQKENDVTDIEDYNDSDSEEEEESKVYPELKMSLQEFLQHGLHAQAVVNKEMQERIEVRAGNFVQSQDLNGVNDYLTDCEDYNTDSELEYDCEKSVCVDLNAALDDPGKLSIKDETRPEADSDEYEDVSVLSDISDINDLATALGEVSGVGLRGNSEDELLEMSGDEEVCQIAYSGSSSESESDIQCKISGDQNLAPIDVAFIAPNGQERRNSVMTCKMNFLDVTSAANEEVLTDVEKMDDSAAEEDSFDDDADDEQPIPRAVILATGDDGACQTDCEDVFCDDPTTSSVSEVQPVDASHIPMPHREVILLKEDQFGDTMTNVMPMDKEFRFGFYNVNEEGQTDTEEYSCADDFEPRCSIAEDVVVDNDLIEGDIIVSNEVMKPIMTKRSDLHSNTESVTDVEEIYVAGTNRRKKMKTRSMSKGKSKYLDVTNKVANKDDGGTDSEVMDLSECGLPPNIKHVSADKSQRKTTADKVTDVEDLTADEVSDVSEADVPSINADNSTLKDYHANSANIVHSQERNAKKKSTKQLQILKLNHLREDAVSQQNTDIEDVQLPSDAEEACDFIQQCQSSAQCNELNDMLNESYTVVHEKSGRSFDVDAEKLHIKGLVNVRDAHTDIEYVESDESAARGGN